MSNICPNCGGHGRNRGHSEFMVVFKTGREVRLIRFKCASCGCRFVNCESLGVFDVQ